MSKDDSEKTGLRAKVASKVSALQARLPIQGFLADKAEVVWGVPPSVTLLFERGESPLPS